MLKEVISKGVEGIDPKKYLLYLNENGQEEFFGKSNSQLVLANLVFLLALAQAKLDKDEKVLEAFSNQEITDINTAKIVNAIKGFSPNGRFHRIYNLAQKITNNPGIISSSVFAVLAQNYHVEEENKAMLNNYLRSYSIMYPANEIIKIIRELLTSSEHNISEFLAPSQVKLANIDFNELILGDFSIYYNDQTLLVICTPKLSPDGSLYQEEPISEILKNL